MGRITALCGPFGGKASAFFKKLLSAPLFYMLLSQILFNIPASKLEFSC
jgi:hypothetical protein